MCRVCSSTIVNGVAVITLVVVIMGCAPKAEHTNDVLAYVNKAGGIFGCQGCKPPEIPDTEEAAAALLEHFEETDTDGDGQLSFGEALAIIEGLLEEQFASLDLDGDGFLTREELHAALYKPEGEGEIELGEETTILLPGDVPLILVHIPAGTFMMGAYPGELDRWRGEGPQHQVTISRHFWMGKYEVTKRQWQAVMGTTPWMDQTYVLDDPDSPAVYVCWESAQAFLSALNTHIESTDQGPATMRLPSEAEWEYACRAGTSTRFYWGDDLSYTEINDYAWYDGNAWSANEMYAHVVGLKLPNAFGLYDMSGNVWEWCQDWHGKYRGDPVTDPTGPETGSDRIFRGGSWNYYGEDSRSASRNYFSPTYTYYHIGFRVAR